MLILTASYCNSSLSDDRKLISIRVYRSAEMDDGQFYSTTMCHKTYFTAVVKLTLALYRSHKRKAHNSVQRRKYNESDSYFWSPPTGQHGVLNAKLTNFLTSLHLDLSERKLLETSEHKIHININKPNPKINHYIHLILKSDSLIESCSRTNKDAEI